MKLPIMGFAIALILGAMPDSSASAKDHQDRLSEYSVAAVAGTTERVQIERLMSQSAAQLAEKRVGAPNARSLATVVFRRALTPNDLQEFAETHRADVHRVELKIPTSNEGIVHTISIGPNDLLSRGGTLQERIAKVVGNVRGRLYQMALKSDKTDSQYLREAAVNPTEWIFKVDLIGTNHEIASIASNPSIAAVVPDNRNDSELRIRDFDARKAAVELRRKSDSPQHTPVVIRNSSQAPPGFSRGPPKPNDRDYIPSPPADRIVVQKGSPENTSEK